MFPKWRDISTSTLFKSGYFTFLLHFVLCKDSRYLKLKNTFLRNYILYSLNACERINLSLHIDTSIWKQALKRHKRIIQLPNISYFFQESMFLFISSLKESILRTRYMLCIVLGAEEIKSFVKQGALSSNPLFTRKNKHGIKQCHESTITERTEERQQTGTKVMEHCLGGAGSFSETEGLTQNLKRMEELTRQRSGTQSFGQTQGEEKRLYHFVFPPAMYERPNLSASLPALGFCCI